MSVKELLAWASAAEQMFHRGYDAETDTWKKTVKQCLETTAPHPPERIEIELAFYMIEECDRFLELCRKEYKL